MLIKKIKLEEIKEKLEKRMREGKLFFSEASKILVREGIANSSLILQALNYEVIWNGIDVQQAEIKRKRIK